MRILVYDTSQQVREGFMINLLSAGYEVIVIKDKKTIFSALAKKPFNIVILEVNENDKEMLQIIKVLRTDAKYSNTKVIVHVLNPSKQFVVEMLKLGIVGYLLKPFNEKEIIPRLHNILEKANVHIPEREHVRVKPDESDNVTIAFRSPVTHKMINGKVTDISVGGVAFAHFKYR